MPASKTEPEPRTDIQDAATVATTQWQGRPQLMQLKADHPITEVLARMGIRPPTNLDGATEFRIPAAALGLPHGDDSSGVLIKPADSRWWAFHAGIGGDVIDLVRAVAGVNSLRDVADLLANGRPIPLVRAEANTAIAAMTTASERPDLTRTPLGRVYAINAQAWRYLTLPALCERARDYLRGRGIDVRALEANIGYPVAGHTPGSRTGLTDYLQRLGFHDDEIVDSGWAVRRPAERLVDRYHARVLLPFRDAHGRVTGVTGRDVTGQARAKYLNHPHTGAFDKSAALYRPSTPYLDEQATVIVCEGTLDALAIASAAARLGVSQRFAPVSQSGLSLTDRVAPQIFALHPRPPILCGDGDAAGQHATARWAARAITVFHREVLTLSLPDGRDPAEWLAQDGDLALITFSRSGCLTDEENVRARPAGALLARYELDHAMATASPHNPGVEPYMVAPIVTRRLGVIASELPSDAAINRFADAACDVLAQLVDGHSPEVRRTAIIAASRESTTAPSNPNREVRSATHLLQAAP